MSREVEVVEVVEEAQGIRSLRLRKSDGTAFPHFRAGAHIDVTGPTGILRQYSLASDPMDTTSLLIAVKLETESKGGSAALHTVVVGDRLTISSPRNLLSVADDAERHLLVAEGIGVTPLLGIAYELRNRGAAFELHYFVRAREQLAFADLFEQQAAFREHVTVHVGIARTEHAAVLTPLAAALIPGTHVYTCGPEGFMDTVSTIFAPIVGIDQVHIEHFNGQQIDTPGDAPFTIEFDTGEVFTIPADQSILSVLDVGST